LNPEIPSLIFITGTDGAGKTSIARWIVEYLEQHGLRTGLVWSRFNNYLSKPILALTRFSGHNYYKTIDGVLFGFHNFERLKGFRYLFAILQAIDVNIATLYNISRNISKFDILICERGPWDTLVDVISDTGLNNLPDSLLGRMFTSQIKKSGSIILYINRTRDNIISTRPELIHDYKLNRKIAIYNHLAETTKGWFIIDNNHSLKHTQTTIAELIKDKTGIE
jgi:thymidylate kinase